MADDEVDMLLSDAIAVPALPIALAAGDDVSQPDLARNQVAISHKRRQDAKERGLVLCEQVASRPVGAALWRRAPNLPPFSGAGEIFHDDHFQSSFDTTMNSKTPATSG